VRALQEVKLALALLLVAACGGTRGGSTVDDRWTLQAAGGSLEVELTDALPERSFVLRATSHHVADDGASLDAAVALTLEQATHLASHDVDWPLRNEFCQTQGEGFCRRFVKWQELAPVTGACDGAGTCVVELTVTVASVDGAALPAVVELHASGYLTGDVAEPDGQDPPPPAGTTFTLELLPPT
jgi:hypothetical protein